MDRYNEYAAKAIAQPNRTDRDPNTCRTFWSALPGDSLA
jgi:hypothetical protein